MTTTTPSSPPSSSSTSTTFITDQVSIAAFNRGPVTASFTPPVSCLSTLTLFNSQFYFGHRAEGYFDTACYPSSTSSLAADAWDVYYYSPAQCPSGWAQATSIAYSFGRSATQLSLGSDTTAVVCCPGYFYVGNDHACQSNIASTTTSVLYISPVLNNNLWYSTDGNAPSTTTITETATSANWILGDGIAVWWQSSDLKAFAAATGTSSTPTQSTGTQSTSTATHSVTSTPSSHGLSSGAKIGIGIGIPLGVIALGLIGFFVYFRRRRRNPIPQTEPQETSEFKAPGEPELQDTSKYGAPAHEMYSDNEPRSHYELSS
ncbi:uncharacterized protein LY89DRAFT_785617 [Mollisia scopiformis]|uniref:Uncharacterized protein n=1 Tax=Mollisia scopiformis TaxID=149040 RepID=A0A194WYS7_MOLSC|nr:uncharacterized protein LY89DRAFT_785617 [Mollisia scopiformis]KUJ13118.1 hypothetical protein LY89DRAFT_785617 [Mollisia scopiformis]